MSQKIVGYGELLLRLTPYDHGSLIEQSDTLKVGFAGAEANIIADLALLGHTTAFVSAFPNNPIGRKANYFLQNFGINTQAMIWDKGRMGAYYIEHGSSIRGTRVTYDRANSSISQTKISNKTWESIFNKTNYFILTGITPALSQICRDNIKKALAVAKAKGVKVVFDLNYRRTLWTTNAARKSFENILPFVDILIGNIGSAFDVFDINTSTITDYKSLKKATKQATEGLEQLGDFETIAMTLRLQNSADDNVLGGILKTQKKYYFSSPLPVKIIDRLGGGDAFTAAALHGMIKKWKTKKVVDFATAAFAITQTIPGDINYATEKELLAIAAGNLKGFVKR